MTAIAVEHFSPLDICGLLEEAGITDITYTGETVAATIGTPPVYTQFLPVFMIGDRRIVQDCRCPAVTARGKAIE